jgi:hypothetical protein
MLIVGKCTEPILYEIYDFLCKLFQDEYTTILGKKTESILDKPKGKNTDSEKSSLRKIRKKTIYIVNESL